MPVTVEQWIGISTDEADRMKTSPVKWQTLRYPLIESGLNRADCEAYLRDHAEVPVKSCCVFCPYQSDRRWQRMKAENGHDWARALEVDRAIRAGIPGTHEPLYLHRSRVELESAVYTDQLDLFGDECAGICGV